MLAIGLILAVGLTVAVDDPSALVERLGSARYAERRQASEALADLGRNALPALRDARQSRDAEVRSQAAALIETIESRLLVEGTQVPLDFADTPLHEVAQTLSERSGMQIQLLPDNPATWKDRKVHLVADEPVPFWTAVSALCQAAGLSYQFASGPFGVGRQAGSVLRLMPGAQDSAPVADSGPFRATLTSIHHTRQRNLAMPRMPGSGRTQVKADPRIGLPRLNIMPGDAAGAFHEDFHVQMQIVAEPRLTMGIEGTPRVIEAIDDRGQSLAIETPRDQQQRYAGYSFGYAMPTESSMLQFPIPLKYPSQPGEVIRRLRIGLALQVAARRPEPTVLPIAEANGQTIRNSEISIEVREAKPQADGASSLDLTIQSLQEPDPNPQPGAPPMIPRYNGPDSYRNPLEFVDDQDRPLPWFTASMQGGPNSSHLTIRFLPNDPNDANRKAARPAKIRLYEMNRARTELTLEFQDIPMPLP